MLGNAGALKRFEYLPLRKELKSQTSAAKKQHQKLNKVFKPNKKCKKVELSEV